MRASSQSRVFHFQPIADALRPNIRDYWSRIERSRVLRTTRVWCHQKRVCRYCHCLFDCEPFLNSVFALFIASNLIAITFSSVPHNDSNDSTVKCNSNLSLFSFPKEIPFQTLLPIIIIIIIKVKFNYSNEFTLKFTHLCRAVNKFSNYWKNFFGEDCALCSVFSERA